VARGIEYDVPYAGVPSSKVSFDGYDAQRGVMLDAKDWNGYPPSGTKFWSGNRPIQGPNCPRTWPIWLR
jgi:hypothetical protein